MSAPHELAAEALHIRRRWGRNRIEGPNPFASAGNHCACHGSFKVASFALCLVYPVATQITFERGQFSGNGLIASIEAHQQPEVGLEFVLVHALALFENLAQMLLCLRQTCMAALRNQSAAFE